MTKTHIIIPPVIVGAATLAGFVIMYFLPAPAPLNICLKEHNVDSFNLHPRLQIQVDGKDKFLPAGVGINQKDGRECVHVIHTDQMGDTLHIQFVRPIRLTMGDFMKIYSSNNSTITVADNSSGNVTYENLTLKNYDVDYSYFTTTGYSPITNLTHSPPFTDSFLGRINLRSK